MQSHADTWQSHAVTCSHMQSHARDKGRMLRAPPPHAHTHTTHTRSRLTVPILTHSALSAHVVIRLAVMFWAWEGGEVGLAVGVGAHDRGTMRCGPLKTSIQSNRLHVHADTSAGAQARAQVTQPLATARDELSGARGSHVRGSIHAQDHVPEGSRGVPRGGHERHLCQKDKENDTDTTAACKAPILSPSQTLSCT